MSIVHVQYLLKDYIKLEKYAARIMKSSSTWYTRDIAHIWKEILIL